MMFFNQIVIIMYALKSHCNFCWGVSTVFSRRIESSLGEKDCGHEHTRTEFSQQRKEKNCIT